TMTNFPNCRERSHPAALFLDWLKPAAGTVVLDGRPLQPGSTSQGGCFACLCRDERPGSKTGQPVARSTPAAGGRDGSPNRSRRTISAGRSPSRGAGGSRDTAPQALAAALVWLRPRGQPLPRTVSGLSPLAYVKKRPNLTSFFPNLQKSSGAAPPRGGLSCLAGGRFPA